jgi:lipopolysaccharide/colanic/teichoic acid biosynthesis glycosyltransferase
MRTLEWDIPQRKFRKLIESGDVIKRLIDIILATCVLAVTWPLILTGALLIKITSPGAAFYRSRRAGKDGRLFLMMKLRTMRANADTADRKITDAKDDRVTTAGRWLRKLKIDELPQFWNVIRGDMSIVGPRPEDYDFVQQYYTPEQKRSLQVRPGIASPTEVRWYPDMTYHDPPREGVSTQEHYLSRHLPAQVNEALSYIENQSILLDFKVIVQIAYCILVHSWWPPKKVPVILEDQGQKTVCSKSSERHLSGDRSSKAHYTTSELLPKR